MSLLLSPSFLEVVELVLVAAVAPTSNKVTNKIQHPPKLEGKAI
jgi:hypothetical protein